MRLNALRYIVSRMQYIKGSRVIFIMNKVIVTAPDAVWPVLEENNFSPYIDKCHVIIIGKLKSVTQASNIRLALVKFLSLTRTQVIPLTALLLLSLARLTCCKYSTPRAAYKAQRINVLSWNVKCSCSFSTMIGETPRGSRPGIRNEMKVIIPRKLAVVFLVTNPECLWGIFTPMY